MYMNSFTKENQQGEPSFVMKSYMGYKKERTNETINTWCGRWESHFKLYLTQDSTKIAYVSQELGGKAAACNLPLKPRQHKL